MSKLIELIAEATKSPTIAWRLLVTVVIGVHIAWACSLLPGIAGFAMAEEVDDVKGRLTEIEKKQDIALRIALAEEICRLYTLRAANENNQALWRTLNATFNDRQEDYRAVNDGQPYNIGECSRVPLG